MLLGRNPLGCARCFDTHIPPMIVQIISSHWRLVKGDCKVFSGEALLHQSAENALASFAARYEFFEFYIDLPSGLRLPHQTNQSHQTRTKTTPLEPIQLSNSGVWYLVLSQQQNPHVAVSLRDLCAFSTTPPSHHQTLRFLDPRLSLRSRYSHQLKPQSWLPLIRVSKRSQKVSTENLPSTSHRHWLCGEAEGVEADETLFGRSNRVQL
jgi:hypothetical protein